MILDLDLTIDNNNAYFETLERKVGRKDGWKPGAKFSQEIAKTILRILLMPKNQDMNTKI